MRRFTRCSVPLERGVVGRTKSFGLRYGGRIPLLHIRGGTSYAAQLQKGVFPLKQFLSSVRLSMREIGSIRTIAVCGMLLALKMVLNLFTINVGSLLKIGFAYLPIAAAGILFGPIVGGIVGAAGDILGYFVQPSGPYFPGFTLNAFLSGFLYGLLLYRRPVKLTRTFTTKALITLLVSLVLNPLWLSVLYGKAFFAVVSARIAANLAMLPIDTAVLFALLKVIEKSRVVQMMQKKC